MNWGKWVRQLHRWLSMAFTVAVIANVIALMLEQQAVWVGIMALIPLALLLLTGLYLLVEPYVGNWRSERNAGGTNALGETADIRGR